MRAFALALPLVVALAAPVAGQLPYAAVAGPASHEAVKKRALWTNCIGVSLSTHVNSDTPDLSEESVGKAAEAALRSARVYYAPENPAKVSRWVVRVVVWGVAHSAHYVAIEFLDTMAGRAVLDQLADAGVVSGDLDFLRGGGPFGYSAMTYRVHRLGSGQASAAVLLAGVREQMDTFLVDYLRAHADCAEGSP